MGVLNVPAELTSRNPGVVALELSSLNKLPEPYKFNFPAGVVVPIPTFPLFNTVKNEVVAEAVEEAILNKVVLVSPLLAWRESLAKGVVVPMPTLPPA